MKNQVCFIGHRDLLPCDIRERIKEAVLKEIKLGSDLFSMGVHGNFDSASLAVCREIRREYKNIKIEVVLTSINQIKPEIEEDEYGKFMYNTFDDVKTIMYDIENEFYKRKITASNKQMIDNSNTLICYVRPGRCRSGAKTAMNYAIKKGLKIINLFDEKDLYQYCQFMDKK